mgnify:CR=1 FL=1
MKTIKFTIAVAVCILSLSSCIVSHVSTETMKANYEKKTHHTTFWGKTLFGYDKLKMDTYNNVKVYMNEQEVGRDFEVVAYGSYRPIVIPIIREERPRIERYIYWKAARRARKLGADGAIIDSKNDFRVIKFK